jgi:4-alpha-glucanotransferase
MYVCVCVCVCMYTTHDDDTMVKVWRRLKIEKKNCMFQLLLFYFMLLYLRYEREHSEASVFPWLWHKQCCRSEVDPVYSRVPGIIIEQIIMSISIHSQKSVLEIRKHKWVI